MTESDGFVTFVHDRIASVTPALMANPSVCYNIFIDLEYETLRRVAPFSAKGKMLAGRCLI